MSEATQSTFAEFQSTADRRMARRVREYTG